LPEWNKFRGDAREKESRYQDVGIQDDTH